MRNRVACFCASVVLLTFGPPLLGADAAKPTGPEEVLAARGLTRAGAQYLVEGDTKLPEGLRNSTRPPRPRSRSG